MLCRVALALVAAALSGAPVAREGSPMPADYLADARDLDREIATQYAYLDRFPGGELPVTPQLTAERESVHDRDSLLHYAEDRLRGLADHHAISNRSLADDWALVPSYADLWIVQDARGYRIDAVRVGSPAEQVGIVPGDQLVAVGGVPIASAVATFWVSIGRPPVTDADAFAARVLAAGRRDRPRILTIAGSQGIRTLAMPSLYALPDPPRPPVARIDRPGRPVTLRFTNSLGDQATIGTFDAAMAAIPSGAPIELDLTDTPSGGNTSVARAIMGWFAARATGYQIHNLPEEERETGIARQWMEQVLPRPGKYHAGSVSVRVGRWTGSMGEGLAAGMAALGARLCGGPMAGLRGGVYDIALPASGLVVKLPAERTLTTDGVPRETLAPPPCRDQPA